MAALVHTTTMSAAATIHKSVVKYATGVWRTRVTDFSQRFPVHVRTERSRSMVKLVKEMEALDLTTYSFPVYVRASYHVVQLEDYLKSLIRCVSDLVEEDDDVLPGEFHMVDVQQVDIRSAAGVVWRTSSEIKAPVASRVRGTLLVAYPSDASDEQVLNRWLAKHDGAASMAEDLMGLLDLQYDLKHLSRIPRDVADMHTTPIGPGVYRYIKELESPYENYLYTAIASIKTVPDAIQFLQDDPDTNLGQMYTVARLASDTVDYMWGKVLDRHLEDTF